MIFTFTLNNEKLNKINIGEDKPMLRDLLFHVIPQYAARWKEIGMELELKDYHMKNIDLDNQYHPHRTTQCFRCVLEQWLRETSSPTWGKLDDAIKGKLLKTVGSDLHKRYCC